MNQSSIGLIILLLSAPAHAQDAQDKGNTDIKVQRIRPLDLPGLEESKIPTLLGSGASLPRMPKPADITAMQTKVAPQVLRVIVEAKRFSTLQRTPIVMEGQAIWISARDDGSLPVLVTPAHWLDGAAHVWVHPPEPEIVKDQLSAGRSNIQTFSTKGAASVLKDPAFVPATVRTLDKGRNLAVLELDPENLAAPAVGLTFFPIETTALSFLYGLTPYSQFRPQIARIVEPSGENEALLFYLASDFLATPGAPLVAPTGELVAIVSMQHPTEPLQSLIVPPLALLTFVRHVQGLQKTKLVEDVPKPE